MFYHPPMGRWTTTFAAVGLVLVAAAPAVSAMAGGPSLGQKVPGLGQYAGGRYCITQTPPWHKTTTPDTVTVYPHGGQPTTWDMHRDLTGLQDAINQADKIEECWEGK